MGAGKGPARTRAERAEQALTLRAQGLTATEIAKRMGISRSYAGCLISDPSGEQDRVRKESYGGQCERCGNPTSGSDGRHKAPRYCKKCWPEISRKWTRERIIEAIQEWARRRGRAPTASEWIGPNIIDPDGYEFPGASSIYDNRNRRDKEIGWDNEQPFTHWADAIEAAGFPRPRSNRNYVHRERWEVSNMSPASHIRPYLVFTVDDGTYTLINEVDAKNAGEAIEICATQAGDYAAVAKSSLTEYRVEPRLVAMPANNANRVGSAKPKTRA